MPDQINGRLICCGKTGPWTVRMSRDAVDRPGLYVAVVYDVCRFCRKTRWRCAWTRWSITGCRTPPSRWRTSRTHTDPRDCSHRPRSATSSAPRTSPRSCLTARTSVTSCRSFIVVINYCSRWNIILFSRYYHLWSARLWTLRTPSLLTVKLKQAMCTF